MAVLLIVEKVIDAFRLTWATASLSAIEHQLPVDAISAEEHTAKLVTCDNRAIDQWYHRARLAQRAILCKRRPVLPVVRCHVDGASVTLRIQSRRIGGRQELD